jgi:alpha-beta hydrolase superfamily lysophospholipase
MTVEGGLATGYWKQYYEPDEVEELLASSTVSGLSSGNIPIHLRLHEQPRPAPTVVMAHGVFLYGLITGRLQLPFFRAGFNVVQFDLPGMGQSGGPRSGCTLDDILRAWTDVLDFARERFGRPLFAMGIAEDGVMGYYAAANRVDVSALSVHTLFEYGDLGGVDWIGSAPMIRLQQAALAVGSRLLPNLRIDAWRMVPVEDVFAAPDDGPYRELLAHDPLVMHGATLRFMNLFSGRRRAPVPFEECRTPVQVLASDANRIWPHEMVVANYERLGGPKELITLRDRPQWWFKREWMEEYAAHVIAWFRAHL